MWYLHWSSQMSLNLNPDTYLLIYILVLDEGRHSMVVKIKFLLSKWSFTAFLLTNMFHHQKQPEVSTYIYTQHLQQQALGRACFAWNSSFNLLMEVQWSNFQSAVQDLQSPFINGQEAISWRPKWRTQNFCCSFSSSYQGSSSTSGKSTLAMDGANSNLQ